MKNYDHKAIESKWQEFWTKNKIYTTLDTAPGKDNFFLLVEFPYPSGNLHVGHWYAFAVPDILARYQRMKGKNVMFPIGFDAFGLPAENAAIKNKLNPRKWTEGNIEYMKKQIQSMGTSFDWSREVVTCDPAYYKWTQWLFLQLYNKGLVYQKETAVNWCPKDKTVLANEQVVDGKCERCDSEVEQRMMLQWNIKITDYADRLIDDLEPLNWPEQIKESQKNWIGRSEGAEIDFGLDLGEKSKYVILHGYKSRPDRPRWLWIKAELEKLGHEVIIPALPSPDEPIEGEWVNTALRATDFDERTILVGHSLGAVAAMKTLQKLNEKIAGLVLIDPAIASDFPGAKERPFWKTFNWDIDYKKLASLTKHRLVLSDLQETQRVPYLEQLAPKLEAKLIQTTAVKAHFTGNKEPDVLMWLRPTIRVFTTRPDTLFGATYLVLAPEHPWVKLALEHKTVLKNNDEVQAYVDRTAKMSDMDRQTTKEKTGVRLEGVEALNPATGEKIPLYIADYVLGHYGTGAIMAVPAHDERDYEFAKKFSLPIQQVIRPVFKPENRRPDSQWRNTVSAFVRNDKGEVLMLRWPQYKWLTGVVGGIEDGETPEQTAVREVHEETGYRAKVLIVSPIAVESHYFAEHKNEWRSRVDTPVLLELERDERDAVASEEAARHEAHWIKIEEVLQMEMFKNNKLALELALGRVGAYTTQHYNESPTLMNSGQYDGMSVEDAKKGMTEAFGRKKTTYKLRDWIVSRQRYWGVPIPMIHCEKCGIVPVPDKDLPVELPEVKDYLPEGSGKSPLAKVKKFVDTECPKCGGKAKRETDTLDTFVDSSWYFLRYTDPKNSKQFAAGSKQKNWLPVDLYSGGAEHTTMHLLYSRFWHKALYDMEQVADAEPYTRRMNRSIILGPDGQKMSKSHGNVVDPDEVVARLGADTVRMYLAFVGPYNEVSSFPWNPDGVVGVRRFLERVWRLQEKAAKKASDGLTPAMHKAIKKVGEDIAAQKFNTAISQLMILLNDMEKRESLSQNEWTTFLRLIAPFAPHMSEELWTSAGNNKSVHVQDWPQYDEKYLVDDEVTYGIQIDGKTRGEVRVATNADKETVEKAAHDVVVARLEGKTIKRVIVVPGRLVNFVSEN